MSRRWVAFDQCRSAGPPPLPGPYERLFERLNVGEGVRLLDIACGFGFAAHLAAGRGAAVTGLDVSEPLLVIARARTPAGDLRLGDMLHLPFDDAASDVATSFNGIWKGFDGAMTEAHRVLRPGGLLRHDVLGLSQEIWPAALR
jgi:ubiquinone/menaquinone biosynthesis C-methylase UbiE